MCNFSYKAVELIVINKKTPEIHSNIRNFFASKITKRDPYSTVYLLQWNIHCLLRAYKGHYLTLFN